jgi:hypothetical protein
MVQGRTGNDGTGFEPNKSDTASAINYKVNELFITNTRPAEIEATCEQLIDRHLNDFVHGPVSKMQAI